MKRFAPNSRALVAVCAFYFAASFVTVAHGETPSPPPRPRLPLVSGVNEILFLGEARDALARAQAFENRNEIFGAVLEYERLIDQAATQAESQHTYEYFMVLAGAHLEAAHARLVYGGKFANNLTLKEQNEERVVAHLREIPGLVVAASKLGPPGDPRFKCEAYKLLANGLCFQGIVESNSANLLRAIEIYHDVEKCDPGSAVQTGRMISYAKSLEADISKRVFRADNIAKVISKVVSLSVPRFGNYLSAAVDFGYQVYREKKSGEKMPMGPR